MKIAVVELTDEEYENLQPLLKLTNRTYKNFCQSAVLNCIRIYSNGNSMFDISNLGTVNKKPK